MKHAFGVVQWLNADTAGTQYPVTGLGFKPKAIRFYCTGVQSTVDVDVNNVNLNQGVGFAKSPTERRCAFVFNQDANAAANTGCGVHDDCVIGTTTGAGAAGGQLDLLSMDDDGFTLVIDVQTISADITVGWDAWGDDQYDNLYVFLGDILEPGATGDQDYDVPFFDTLGQGDQVVMFGGSQSVSALNANENQDSGFCFGFATGPTTDEQNAIVVNSDDGSATMDTEGCARGDFCLGMATIAGAATLSAYASWTQWNAGGFRLNWPVVSGAARRSIFMAIKGGRWQCADRSVDAVGLGAVKEVSDLPFNLVGIHMFGQARNALTLGNVGNHAVLAEGSAKGKQQRQSISMYDVHAVADVDINLCISYDRVLEYPDGAGGAKDIEDWNQNGFSIRVTELKSGGGTNAEWMGFLAFGTDPDVPPLMGQQWL